METINSIEAIKANIKHEKDIIKEASLFANQLDVSGRLEERGFAINAKEKNLLVNTVNSLLEQLKILNDAIPELVNKISVEEPSKKAKKPKKLKKKERLVSLHKQPFVKTAVIKKSDRAKFLKELSLTDESIRRLKKERKIEEEKVEEFKKPSIYAKLSNRFFLKLSTSLINKGYFARINRELRKANLYFLSHTYISMAFFSSLIAFFVSIVLLIVLLFFNLSLEFPFFTLTEESIFLRFLKNFWLLITLPVLTFVIFYFYPSTEKRAISSKINQELPFTVIHMSAIAGSGIEPTKIFKIIITTKEYPNIRKEIKKLLNEINVYGYDIVTALRNSAKMTSSVKLADLFKGLATTISSGGSLKDFLDKRADTLTFDYRLEREKYTRVAETFMDIYISVVIAAPMIMTMLLVMINLTGLGLGLSISALAILIILGITLINIFFLIFLHLKQPKI